MTFIVSIIALTTAAIIFSFLPAFRSLKTERDELVSIGEYEHDIAVYTDQLAELETEKERGLISTEDAAQARAEIARRLLQMEQKTQALKGVSSRNGSQKFSRFFLVASALIFIPGFSALVYTSVGSPGVEAQPLVARLAAMQQEEQARAENNAQLENLVAQAESHLRDNPEDGRGWDVLAPIYLRLGENEKSANAYRNSIRILGETPTRLSGLGEVNVLLSGGTVTSEAEALFKKALELNPLDGRSLYYSAIGTAQAGDVAAAFEGLQAIALNEAIEADWRAAAANTIAQIGQRQDSAPQIAEDTGMPALDRETIEQMGEMAPDDRRAMIVGMVERLENRLSEGGGSLDEWRRLIRAHFVLDQRDEAVAAADSAIEAFSGNENMQNEIRVFAEALGLVLEGESQ